MHLIPKSKLYGQPTIRVRDYLRNVGDGIFDEGDLRARLDITAAESAAVVTGLLTDKFIESALPRDGVPQYGLVAKGGQLAAARFAPQIKRAVAEDLLAGVLLRAADSESQRSFAFHVVKVALFGSMLGVEPLVSDVDLAVQFASRFEGDEWTRIHQQRVELAERNGKRFRTRIQSITWPKIEIIEFLRAGERYISIHSFTELELMDCPYKIVFESPGVDVHA